MIILRNGLRAFIKIFISTFLIFGLSNTYAKKQSQIETEEAADTTENIGSACTQDNFCDVASSVSEDEQYGGIEQEYTVKGCKVTMYNDGPVKMVNEKTDEPCNAPLPKDHKFSKETRTYQENGCIITESVAADGMTDAVKDCTKKK